MDEYLSVQEFARLVNKTQQSIYKRLRNQADKLNNYVKLDDDGKRIIKAEAAQELYKVDLDSHECGEDVPAEDKTELIEILKAQVADQKAELERKNQQIDNLNDRLTDITKALDQQQQLSLMDKKRILELEDLQKKQSGTEPEPSDPQKKWWQFWK